MSVRADVELRLPADSAFAAVLRTTTAGLAARLDFTIEDIDDLRMAVGEASAMVLEQSAAGSDLTCEFFLAQASMTVRVSADAPGVVPDLDSFAWQVLTTLAQDTDITAIDGRYSVSLTMRSSAVEYEG